MGKIIVILAFLLTSCGLNRELWVKSRLFKCLSVTEGHRDGKEVWFVQYETVDGIRLYEMCFTHPNIKPGDYVNAFLIR